MRRLWWFTLPYEGWMGYDGEPGSIPPPWYAYPLARIWRWIDSEISDRDIGYWGPRYHKWSYSSRTTAETLKRGPQSEPWK